MSELEYSSVCSFHFNVLNNSYKSASLYFLKRLNVCTADFIFSLCNFVGRSGNKQKFVKSNYVNLGILLNQKSNTYCYKLKSH